MAVTREMAFATITTTTKDVIGMVATVVELSKVIGALRLVANGGVVFKFACLRFAV